MISPLSFSFSSPPSPPPLPPSRGRDTPESGRYYRKGMRIDLLLLESKHVDRLVDAVEITGAGECNGDESFCGSDHCPVFVKLKGGRGGEGEGGEPQEAGGGESAESCGEGGESGKPGGGTGGTEKAAARHLDM